MKKNILRFFGICVGLTAVIFGVFELITDAPYSNILSQITKIIVGGWFLFYGLTGKSPFFDEEDNKKSDSNESE